MEIESFVLDTNVLIFLRKRKMLRSITMLYDVAITWVTLYEFLRGLRCMGRSKREIEKIKRLLEKIYTILWPTNQTIRILTEIWYDLRRKGRIIDDRDLFIGVLCIENRMPIWTFNRKDFEPLEKYGLRLIEPKFPDIELT